MRLHRERCRPPTPTPTPTPTRHVEATSARAPWPPTLWASLRHPRTQIRALAALAPLAFAPRRHAIPVRLWSVLAAIALGGTLLFGASLGPALPAWRSWRGAAWLALAAGTSWLVFAPLL